MFLGIDIGTSAVKAVLWDGQIVGEASAPLSVQHPHPGWSEQSPQQWWDAVCAACGQLDVTGVRAVGLSGQMHGAVLLGRDRQVLRPAMLWNDNRAIAEAQALAQMVPDLGQVAGVPALPGLTAPKMLWLTRNAPDLGVRHMLLPKDYIAMRLTGAIATDPSDAAGTLLFDQAKGLWSDRIAEACKVDTAWLPRIVSGSSIVGTTGALGLPPGTPVVAGAGDTVAGAVSIGLTQPGRGMVSLGTSGQLFIVSDGYAPRPDAFVHAFAHTLPGLWYQMAAMLNGARPISWLAGVLNVPPASVPALAAQADLRRVPVFLPYLTGERSPHGDPNARAGFFGLTDATGAAEMARAVLEGIAFSFSDALDSFGDTTTPETVAAIGGGSRSDLLLQLIADATGLTVTRAGAANAGPAVGAAKLAALGAGALSRTELDAQPVPDVAFAPDPEESFLHRRGLYRSLYRALKPLADRLDD